MKLKYPVDVKGEKITELNMRRPKVRDLLIADKTGGSDAAKEVAMFVNLCEVDAAVIEELDASDYRKLQEEYSGFLA